MPLAFLTPLFLAGLGLLAIPWLLHRIRRPEREPVRFSSLMFMPKVAKEVIERRRLQHLLLMLMRMAALALLALAFARPVWRAKANAPAEGAGVRRAILLDRSLSMGTTEGDQTTFLKAKRRVNELLERRSAVDWTALFPFAAYSDTPPIEFQGQESSASAAAASAVEIGQEGTDYVAALERAQAKLLEGETDASGKAKRLELYLVSDFQRNGFKADKARFRLSPRIHFIAEDVGREIDNNLSVAEAAVRVPREGKLRVQAKLRNGSPRDPKEAEARLVIGGEVRDTRKATLAPGSASLVSFELDRKPDESVAGWIELAADDDLTADNRRYFAYGDPPRHPIAIIGAEASRDVYPPEALVRAAIGDDAAGPWKIESPSRADAFAQLSRAIPPEVAVLCDPGALDASAGKAIADYLAKGGRIFCLLGPRTPAADANAAIFAPLGLSLSGPLFADEKPGQYVLLASIDFTHPVFAPFAGARFNDFSQLRIFNHDLLTGPADKMKVLAKFEPDEKGTAWPAIAEFQTGSGATAGRMIVWTFGAGLDWSNAPKTVKFAPLVQETLRNLVAAPEGPRDWTVGDNPLKVPEKPRLDRAGLIAWTDAPWEYLDDAAMAKPLPARIEAVNIDSAESDLRRIDPSEFALRIGASNAADPATAAAPAQAGISGDWIILRSFWRPLLLLMAAGLLLEVWYAARVMR